MPLTNRRRDEPRAADGARLHPASLAANAALGGREREWILINEQGRHDCRPSHERRSLPRRGSASGSRTLRAPCGVYASRSGRLATTPVPPLRTESAVRVARNHEGRGLGRDTEADGNLSGSIWDQQQILFALVDFFTRLPLRAVRYRASLQDISALVLIARAGDCQSAQRTSDLRVTSSLQPPSWCRQPVPTDEPSALRALGSR